MPPPETQDFPKTIDFLAEILSNHVEIFSFPKILSFLLRAALTFVLVVPSPYFVSTTNTFSYYLVESLTVVAAAVVAYAAAPLVPVASLLAS